MIEKQPQSDRKKIAIYYPAFMGGGAEAVALWMLEALQDAYDLTLFTAAAVDFDRLNTMYGTRLSAQSVKVQALLPARFRSLCHSLIANNGALRMIFFHWLIRVFKQHQPDYDLGISAFNAVDLGRRGIQYIHWINVIEGNPIYWKISHFTPAQLSQNISLANSSLVAESARKRYGVEPTVVFPPVVMEAIDLPWDEKEDAFICSGRFTQAKQPHKVIQILKQVRERGFDVKLHMTGGGGGAYEWKYQRFFKQMVQENQDWVTTHENLPYKDYVKILSRCRYGFHFKQEPFGISIAEMVKAGALPFVRSKGGQVEIVGAHHTDLLFDNPEDAVEKIVAVLSNPDRQAQLRQSLTEQKQLFSTQRFMGEIRQAVQAYFTNPADSAVEPVYRPVPPLLAQEPLTGL